MFGLAIGAKPVNAVIPTLRLRLAERLRHFAAGRLANDEFEEASEADQHQARLLFPGMRDRGAEEVVWAAWYLYSDLYQHCLVGRHKLTPERRREVARWCLFLYTDCPYRWSFSAAPTPGCLLNLLTGGEHARRMERKTWSEGDLGVWPFLRYDEYHEARRRPPLLGGTRRRLRAPARLTPPIPTP